MTKSKEEREQGRRAWRSGGRCYSRRKGKARVVRQTRNSNGWETKLLYLRSFVRFVSPGEAIYSFLASVPRFSILSILLYCYVRPVILVSYLKRWKNKWADVLENQETWSWDLGVLPFISYKSWQNFCGIASALYFRDSAFCEKLLINVSCILRFTNDKSLFMLRHVISFLVLCGICATRFKQDVN